MSFDYGGPSELIKESRGGFTARHGELSEFSKAIIELLENPILVREMGLNAYNFANRELHPQKYAEYLRGVIKVLIVDNRMKREHDIPKYE